MSCIGIDCRFASLPVGIGTYTRNIVPRLLDHLHGHHCVLFVKESAENWQVNLPDTVTCVSVPAKQYSFQEQIRFPYRIKQSSIDLLYSPHFNVPLFCAVPFVVTIHDLILHKYPNAASLLKQIAYRTQMRFSVKKAHSVIAVSEYTTSEIQSTYNRDDVRLVTEGMSDQFKRKPLDECKSILQKHDLTPGYFLYVGGAKQHKNVQTLIDAHTKLHADSHLVLISNGPEARRLKLRNNAHLISDIRDEELPYFYSGAQCFVTASLYEGFCLPILEARACGCPIIASNVTALPEIAGPSAHLIDPTINGITEALQNPPHQSDLPEKRYNWDTVASDIASILLSAL